MSSETLLRETRHRLPWPLLSEAGPVACRLGLGTHALHRLLRPGARRRLLDCAYDVGVRYFDTAPSYGAGLAERELGRFAAGRRSSIVLTTKFGIVCNRVISRVPAGGLLSGVTRAALKAAGLQGAGEAPHWDFRAARVRQSVEASLRALRTDHIDVLYLHAPSLRLLADPGALSGAIEALRGAGKIGRVGLAGVAPECLEIARLHPALAEVLQIEVPRDADGLPSPGPLDAAAAIGFWEEPSAAAPAPLAPVLERLRSAVSGGMIMLSTRRESTVREAGAFLAPQTPGHAQEVA